MLKKIAAIALSGMMLVSVFSVSAEIITESSGKTIYTDDFEHVEIATNSTEKIVNGYGSGSDKYVSDVISPAAQPKEGRGLIHKSLGVNNSQAFKSRDMDGGADKRRLYTRALDLGASGTKWYEFSFDFQTSAVQEGLYMLSALFYFNANGVIRTYESSDSTSRTDGGTYTKNTWYKAEVIVHGTSMQGWIYNEKGNLVAESVKTYSDSGYEAKKLCIYAVNSSYKSNPYVTLDNLKLVEYDPSVVRPEMVKSSVSNNAVKVNRKLNVTLQFDQPMTVDSSKPALYKVEENGEQTQVVGATFTPQDDSRKIDLSYEEGLLERDTQYVISFEGLKNPGGITCNTDFSFTTEDLHVWEPVTGIDIGEQDDETGKTPITFTIEDKESYGYPDFSGSVLVMVYQGGKMVTYDLQALTEPQPVGDCTLDFDLGTVPADAEVRIVLLDCLNAPIPVATGTTAE